MSEFSIIILILENGIKCNDVFVDQQNIHTIKRVTDNRWIRHFIPYDGNRIEIDLCQRNNNENKPFTSCENAKYNDIDMYCKQLGFYKFGIYKTAKEAREIFSTY